MINYFKKFLHQPWTPYAVLMGLGFLLYAKSLLFGLTYLDDNYWTLDLRLVHKTPADCWHLFWGGDMLSPSFYRPLLNISFVLNAWAGQNALWAYHAVNIIIHLINAALVFACFQKIGHDRELSFWASLIWMVHPALTSAVVWISGRTDSLLAIFILSSLIMFLNYLQKRSWGYFIGHLVFWAAALLTKENAVMLPVLCLGYVVLFKEGWTTARDKAVMIFSWLAVGIGWYVIRRNVLRHDLNMANFESLRHNITAVVSYFGKTILPLNLSVYPELKDITLGWGFGAIALLGILVFVARPKRRGPAVWGALWFVLFIVPTLMVDSALHEYRLYLPIVGLMLVVMETDLLRVFRLTDKDSCAQKKKIRIILGAIALAFALKTFYHMENYRDRFVFWHSAVMTSPHASLARNNLGSNYLMQYDLGNAEKEYRAALALNPGELMVHNNLGIVYVMKKQYAQAAAEYQQEIALNPTYGNVYYNLGALYYNLNQLPQAVYFWKKTLEYNGEHADALRSLAAYYFSQGDRQQLKYYLEKMQKYGIAPPEGVR